MWVLDDSPIIFIFTDEQPEAPRVHITVSSHTAPKCQSQLKCKSPPNHDFNPMSVVDGGKEMSTLALPLLWTSLITPVVHNNFHEVNILSLALS